MIDLVSSDVIETSMSSLGTFQRCRKKYHFQEGLKWAPRTVPRVMEVGTLYHASVAAGIGSLTKPVGSYAYSSLHFLDAAIAVVYGLERDRNNMPLYLDQGDREQIEDMVRFSFENYLQAEIDKWDAILAVEQPAYIQIGRYVIRNTFDAVVRYRAEHGGEAWVLDFKTVDDPRTSRDWIPLDFQTRSYPLAARGKWGEAFPFKHIFVSRDVPPGFGHRSVLTDTGKKRDAATLARMSQVENYIGECETRFTGAQLDHFERKLVSIVVDLERARVEQNYPETPIKMGPFGCGGCTYYAPCAFEMDGEKAEFNPLLYIERDSEEWNAMQAKFAAVPE